MAILNRTGSLLNLTEQKLNLQPLMRQVYIWMGLGTLVTATIAYIVINTRLIDLAENPVVLLVAIITELGMVLGLSLGFNRLSSGVATGLFFAYAALNGFTLSVVLLAFSSGTIVAAFGTTATLFGVMSVIGYTTKVDLTQLGTYLMMGVIGLIIALVANLLISSGPLDILISILGVLIFTALTAYDTQRIAQMAAQTDLQGKAATKLGILGALRLYLDFINIFLFILRLMGGNARR